MAGLFQVLQKGKIGSSSLYTKDKRCFSSSGTGNDRVDVHLVFFPVMFVQMSLKIMRLLFSVTQMTMNGDIMVVCKRDEAVVLNAQNQPLAVFKKKDGLYVADLKVRNPRFKVPFGGPAR